jgi:NAD(P)-dependent dehydrogenase (short-subunit alcohol dehydrogenase family)
MRFEGKVAMVTGAGAGIGRAAAVLLGKEGAKVIACGRTGRKCEETVSLIKDARGEADFVEVDVSKATDAQRTVETTIERYNKLDILVNSAGVEGPITPTDALSEEDWDEVVSINLKGVFLSSKYAIIEMLKRGGGVIVNVASVVGVQGDANVPAYCASKGGVIALTKAMALEYASKNIRVNCICPGPIATEMLSRIADNLGQRREWFGEAHCPMGRCGTPEEVAQAILFLATDEASYITGGVLAVDGARSVALA